MTALPGFAVLLRAVLAPESAGGPSRLRRFLALTLVMPPFVCLQLIHWAALRLDEILYPDFRRVQIREPLFVVGLPRSGTTTLHQVLARDTERFTTLRLWELLLAPAISQRKFWQAAGRVDGWVGSPGRRLLRWVEGRATAFMDDIHPVSLDSPEEDYLFLLPLFAAFILVVAYPSHPRLWAISRLDTLPEAEADRLVGFYRSCVQRHLFVVGPERQLLSKNPSFTPFIQALARTFPDARFIGCVRSPAKVVASQLSSLEDAANFFGWSVTEPAYRDRVVGMLAFYAEHLVESFDGLPETHREYAVLSHFARDMAENVQATYRRFGWTPDAAFVAALQEEGERSRRHRSGHRYALEDYGLTTREVEERFTGLMERFGFPTEAAA